MAKKWSEIRRKHAPEVEERILQRVKDRKTALSPCTDETNTKSGELAKIPQDADLGCKDVANPSK